MKLSISNIAWGKEDDTEMLAYIKTSGFLGLEVAPTRIIEKDPYDHLEQAAAFYQSVDELGLSVPSMQSIWFGRTERVFYDSAQRAALAEHTKKAMDFAKTLNCGNLVFGSPKNRVLEDESQREAGLAMIAEIAEYAESKNTVFAVEPNPTIYNTNFINRTEEAFALVKEINQNGLKVNVDIGTMIENGENIGILEKDMNLINHIHISEPYLAVPQKHKLHRDLADLLRSNGYDRFVSIEMKNPGDIQTVKETMIYIREVFR